MPWVGLQSVIVFFPDHTHLLLIPQVSNHFFFFGQTTLSKNCKEDTDQPFTDWSLPSVCLRVVPVADPEGVQGVHTNPPHSHPHPRF